MKNIFTILLFLFISSNSAWALNNCKDFPEGKYSVSCDDAGEIDKYDGIECLFELSNFAPSENAKDIVKYFNDNIKPNSDATKFYGLFSDTWAYRFKDGEGVSGECRSRFPSLNERMYIKRLPSDENPLESKFVVGRDYCWTRKVIGAEGFGHCGWKETEDEEPYEGRWSDNYLAIFGNEDVDRDPKTLTGTALGHQVCLKRTAKYDAFKHNANSKNPGPRNKVCAYVINAGFGCDSYWGLDPATALIGCVDEPLMPGPDVFNSVIPSEIAPKVDTSICLATNDSGSPTKGCNNNKKTLLDRGSTFDKPMVVITDGVPIKDAGGNATGNAKELELRYQFYPDDYDRSIKSCGTIPMPGFNNVIYCAQVPFDDPSVVCACEKDETFQMPKDGEQINNCKKGTIFGCSPRPRLADSNLTIASESKVYIDDVGNKHLAAQVSFVEADKNGSAIYKDKDNNLACLNILDKKYYECDRSGEPSRNLSKLPLSGFKKRLEMPLKDDNSYFIREYFPNTSIPPYKGDRYTGLGDASCQDRDGNDVYYGFDGKFYLLDVAGKITDRRARGEVKCEVEEGRGRNEETIKFSSDTKSRDPQDREITTDPNGYARESKKFYGINFSTMVPAFNADGSVMFLRYLTAKDAILQLSNSVDPVLREREIANARACIPITNVSLCSPQGTTTFVAGGDRDRDYCPKIPDQNNDRSGYPDNDPRCSPLRRGANDAAALKAFCPGVLKVSTSGNGDRVCLEASAGEWNFKKKPESNPLVTQQACSKPVMDADAYCSAVAGALTVPAVTTPSQSSGWTTWPASAPNSTQTGTCDTNLGYTTRKDVRLIRHTKQEICSYNVRVPIVDPTCADLYSIYGTLVDNYQRDLTDEVKKVADRETRNLKPNEIVEIPHLLMAYLQDSQMVEGRDYTLESLPPVRTVDADGDASVKNGCVRVN
jgi:hypothetical protein